MRMPVDLEASVGRTNRGVPNSRRSPEGGSRHDEVGGTARRRPTARKRRPLVAVVGAALTALLLLSATGCASQEDRDRAAVAKQIRDVVVPILASNEELGALTDLRGVERPNEAIRTLFDNLRSTPRVIEAKPDRALLAIWRTAQSGPEPFNANRSATANACVELLRTAEGLQAGVVDCPRPLTEHEPLGEPAYGPVTWARNAEAVAQTSNAASELGREIRWLVFENEDGSKPRTEERIARSIENALDERAATIGNHLLRVRVNTTDFTQEGQMVAGTLVVTAEVPDATDTEGTVTATCRYAVEADLSITSSEGNENWIPVRYLSC